MPVFADCNRDMCISYESVAEKFSNNTVAVCIVNIAGHITGDLSKIQNFCNSHGIKLVEDAAQSHGSTFDGKPSGALGYAAAFSFFSTKVLTTGEGGLVSTNHPELIEIGRKLREFGKSPDGYITNKYDFIGYNWRMPEIASLMGLKQLESFQYILSERSRVADRYDANFSNISSIKRMRASERCKPNNYKYVVDVSSVNRKNLHEHFIKSGIQPSGYVYELPLHSMSLFSEYSNTELPMTDYLCRNHFCLPIYPTLSNSQVDYISDVLIKYMVSVSD